MEFIVQLIIIKLQINSVIAMSYVNMHSPISIKIRHATLSLKNMSHSITKCPTKKIKIHSKGLPKDFFNSQLTQIIPGSVKLKLRISPTFQLLRRHHEKIDSGYSNHQFQDQQPLKYTQFNRSKTQHKQPVAGIFKRRKTNQEEDSRCLNFMNVTFANFKNDRQKMVESKSTKNGVRKLDESQIARDVAQLKLIDTFENRQQRMKHGKIVRKNYHHLPILKRIHNVSSHEVIHKLNS